MHAINETVYPFQIQSAMLEVMPAYYFGYVRPGKDLAKVLFKAEWSTSDGYEKAVELIKAAGYNVEDVK